MRIRLKGETITGKVPDLPRNEGTRLETGSWVMSTEHRRWPLLSYPQGVTVTLVPLLEFKYPKFGQEKQGKSFRQDIRQSGMQPERSKSRAGRASRTSQMTAEGGKGESAFSRSFKRTQGKRTKKSFLGSQTGVLGFLPLLKSFTPRYLPKAFTTHVCPLRD